KYLSSVPIVVRINYDDWNLSTLDDEFTTCGLSYLFDRYVPFKSIVSSLNQRSRAKAISLKIIFEC
ncbi:hypothetical protein V1478_016815, partial [Vespula squamosa]